MKIEIIVIFLIQIFVSCKNKQDIKTTKNVVDETETLSYENCFIDNIKLLNSSIDSLILKFGYPNNIDSTEGYCGLCEITSDREKVICYNFNGIQLFINNLTKKVCDYSIYNIGLINYDFRIDTILLSKKTTIEEFKQKFPKSFNRYHVKNGNQDYVKVITDKSDVFWDFKFLNGILYSIELSTMC